MEKRELLTPVVVAGLAVAFVVISALVWLTRGHPALVRRKLRLGGMLLALTGAAAGCPLVASCYDVAVTNWFQLSDVQPDGTVHLDLRASAAVAGTIHDRTGDKFSFRLSDAASAAVQEGALAAKDGAFDESTEEFEVAVRQDLPAGTYTLSLFDTGTPSPSSTSQSRFTIKITHAR